MPPVPLVHWGLHLKRGSGPSRQLMRVLVLLRNAVLADFVEQRLVADLEQRGRLLAVPVGFIKRFGDGFGLSFILRAASNRFKSTGGF